MAMIKSVRVAGMCVVVALALCAAGTRTIGAAREGSRTLAFLISESDNGLLYGKFEEECPKGFEMTLEESYLASLTPAQKEWMLRPENAFEYGNA